MLSIEERLCPEPNSGCWLWEGSSTGVGYGDFKRNGVHGQIHRCMYEKYRGPIPAGAHVLHTCDVGICGNPNHLFLGTNLDNIKDSMAKGRRKGVPRNRPSGLIYHYVPKPGSRSKLNADQRSEMRARYLAGGISKRQLAREYGVSSAAMSLTYLRGI